MTKRERPEWCLCGKCGPCPDVGKSHCFHGPSNPIRFARKKCRDAYESKRNTDGPKETTDE